MRAFLHTYRAGIGIGVLTGSIGLYVLSLLSLMSQFIEFLATPFMWPSRMMAMVLIQGDTASTGVIILLYVLTALLYGCAGVCIQAAIRLSAGRGLIDQKK